MRAAALHAAALSPGRVHLQSVRVYNAGKEILRTDPGGVPANYSLNNIAIAGGSDYVFVIMGSVGDPYGSYRGQPGIRCALRLDLARQVGSGKAGARET